jgi:glutamate--cysteine ligase
MTISVLSTCAPEQPVCYDELEAIFRRAETPESQWRIGTEAEKFGVDATTFAPIDYAGPRGVLRVLEALRASHGWVPQRESADGPIIALTREAASVTLEPGAQLELSGAPAANLHETDAEMRGHLRELSSISAELNLAWLSVGFHPLATQTQLPWVPKKRYGIMREYLPTRGDGALDMMRRTATVQVNLDFCSESDALDKLRVALRASPIVQAMTANSPFYEGRLAGRCSMRGDVWLRMDPERSGLIPALWGEGQLRYRDYVEWALDAGMFLFKREDRIIANTGQSFRSFLRHGYQGHRATSDDWLLHLNTLFPEVRLKKTIEARCADSLPASLAVSVPALFTGMLYDRRALEAAWELLAPFSYQEVMLARPDLVTHGLRAKLAGQPVQELAERLFEIAAAGLERRARHDARGQDERIHLRRLGVLLQSGRTPADVLLDGLRDGDGDLAIELVARTRT